MDGPITRARKIRRRIREYRKEARRHRQTDSYLISYPKAGRTWLRLMLGLLIDDHFGLRAPDPTDLRAMTMGLADVPTIRIAHDDHPDFKRVEDIHIRKSRYRRKAVVLLVRDPRDVMISEYFQKAKRDHGHETFDLSLEQFVDDPPVGGLPSIIRFYNVWADQRTVPRRFLLVRYEDLHADTVGELRRVAEFLRLPDMPDDQLRRVVAACSFEQMRHIEDTGAIETVRLRPGSRDDPESFKTRRGIVGGFPDYLDEDRVRQVTRTVETELSPFYGYPISS